MSGTAVLLVDADEDSRLICGTVLNHFGYRVLLASSAEGGVQLARAERPDVVVLEIALPGRDGWWVVTQLRSDAGTRHLPVVVMTARVTEVEREQAVELGCAAWLPKPCPPSALIAEIERLVALDPPLEPPLD